MKKLRFEGYSDDTFGEYGITGEDVDNCGSQKPTQCIVDCGERGKLMVVGQYAKASNNACWLIGACPVDDETEMPAWNITIEKAETPYSPALMVEIPDGDFSLRWFDDGVSVERG